jgi:crossover junction endodeoxyribonuclease RuvC
VVQLHDDSWQARAYGCIDTSATQPISERLRDIHEGIREATERYQVEHGAIEEVFLGTNAKSAFSLGQARGVALLACSRCAGGVGQYSANTIKQHIVGHGHADKDQVAYMIRVLLALDHVPQPDHCSDALAVALTHGFALRQQASIKKGQEV